MYTWVANLFLISQAILPKGPMFLSVMPVLSCPEANEFPQCTLILPLAFMVLTTKPGQPGFEGWKNKCLNEFIGV